METILSYIREITQIKKGKKTYIYRIKSEWSISKSCLHIMVIYIWNWQKFLC